METIKIKKYKKQKKMLLSEDEIMYRFFLSAIVVLAIMYFVMTHIEIGSEWMQQCQLHYWTGLYCPGCGATRAVTFLIHGDIINSIFYYPAVTPTVIFVAVYIVSHTLRKITSGKIKGIHYRGWYVVVPAMLVLVNFIWKNYYYIVEGVSLIP